MPAAELKALTAVCWHSAPDTLTSPALVQWQTVGDVQVDTGANASAEEAEETLDDSARKVVDIIESFRLVVRGPFVCADIFQTPAALGNLLGGPAVEVCSVWGGCC